jgi:hypothetical protein
MARGSARLMVFVHVQVHELIFDMGADRNSLCLPRYGVQQRRGCTFNMIARFITLSAFKKKGLQRSKELRAFILYLAGI